MIVILTGMNLILNRTMNSIRDYCVARVVEECAAAYAATLPGRRDVHWRRAARWDGYAATLARLLAAGPGAILLAGTGWAVAGVLAFTVGATGAFGLLS